METKISKKRIVQNKTFDCAIEFAELKRLQIAIEKIAPQVAKKKLPANQELFKAFEDAFGSLIVKIWDTDTNDFHKNFKWPKNWNLKKLAAKADFIEHQSELYGLKENDKYGDLISLFNIIYNIYFYSEPPTPAGYNINKVLTVPKVSLLNNLASFLYAPFQFITDRTPFIAGLAIGTGLTYGYPKANFSLFKHLYQHGKDSFTNFLQQGNARHSFTNTINFSKENTWSLLTNMGILFLGSYVLYNLTKADEEIDYRPKISAAITDLKSKSDANSETPTLKQ